jgi:hypothetical protein
MKNLKMKTIKHQRRKLKKMLEDGKNYVHGWAELIF